MLEAEKEQLGRILESAAAILDIPEELYNLAVEKYQEVARWLGAPDSPLSANHPEIYPQGSFRLGTIIRPLTDKDEYDIDNVCLLELKKQSVSQKELKKRIGDRLKQNDDYGKVLTEGRRCWILNFENRFHMDVLPAIPDEEGAPASILITDKELTRWQHSDPKGYSDWFWDRMRVVFNREKRALAEALQTSVEEVPDWKVKTPLQRAVQLLKRHRDLHFQNDPEDKPASIIITTLAARAYQGQIALMEALLHLAERMPDYIEKQNGVYWVPNPVNDRENFADKWQNHPERREKFFAWLGKADGDLAGALAKRGLDEVTKHLGSSFGKSVMAKAAASVGKSAFQQRQSWTLRMTSGTGALGSTGATTVRGHTFYGGVDE